MGPFSGPWEIADRSKIVLLRDDWDFDPRKMPSWRGFGKNMKIEWKIDAKIEAFWWLKTTFGVILFAYFTLLPFLEKARKSMPKESPQVVFFVQKPTFNAQESIDSVIFSDFWWCEQSSIFLCVSSGPKNRKNRPKWQHQADTRQKTRPPGVDFREPGSQGAALFACAGQQEKS